MQIKPLLRLNISFFSERRCLIKTNLNKAYMTTLKKSLFLASVVLMASGVRAQKESPIFHEEETIALSLGKPINNPVVEQNKFYLGTADDAHFFLRGKQHLTGGSFSIDKVNSSMNVLQTRTVSLTRNGFNVIPYGNLQIGEDIYLLSMDKTKGGNTVEYVARKLDPQKMVFKQMITLASVEAKKINVMSLGNFNFSLQESIFKVRIKPDKSGILVLYNMKAADSGMERFGFNVFDSQLNKSWGMEVEMPYDERMFKIQDLRIDNDESIYLVAKLNKDTKLESVIKNEHANKVFKFKKGDSTPQNEIDIDLEEAYFTSLRLIFRGDRVSALGFYRNYTTSGDAGVFVLNLNKETGALIDYKLTPFSKEFYLMGLSDKKQEKQEMKIDAGKGGKFRFMNLDYVFPQEDDSFVVIAERRYMIYSGMELSGIEVQFVADEIISFKVTAKDEIEWFGKILKDQYITNNHGSGMGYVALANNRRIFILYNEGDKAFDPKVLETKGKMSPFNSYSKGVVSLSVIDENGQVTKHKLLDQTHGKFFLAPQSSAVLPEGVILHFFSKKEKRYGFFTLEKMVQFEF
jgi:hypothetical protein